MLSCSLLTLFGENEIKTKASHNTRPGCPQLPIEARTPMARDRCPLEPFDTFLAFWIAHVLFSHEGLLSKGPAFDLLLPRSTANIHMVLIQRLKFPWRWWFHEARAPDCAVSSAFWAQENLYLPFITFLSNHVTRFGIIFNWTVHVFFQCLDLANSHLAFSFLFYFSFYSNIEFLC